MGTIQGVDSSYDSLTLNEARCLKTRGIHIFVQALTALPRTGLHQPSARISNLRNADAVGLQTAGYLLIGPGMTGKQAVAEARRNIPMLVWNRLKFVAVDVEVTGIDDTQVLAALREVERLGRVAVVYTSWNTWNTMIVPRNSTLIADHGYGVWNASWDNHPGINFTYLPFGGWSPADVIGEQWSGGTLICGQSVDQNTFQEYVLLPVPVVPVTPPSALPIPGPAGRGPILMESNLELRIVKEDLMGIDAWWLTSYPFAWKQHITNLDYMDYMQKKQDWPRSVWKLTYNQKQIFKSVLYLGPIPRPIL